MKMDLHLSTFAKMVTVFYVAGLVSTFGSGWRPEYSAAQHVMSSPSVSLHRYFILYRIREAVSRDSLLRNKSIPRSTTWVPKTPRPAIFALCFPKVECQAARRTSLYVPPFLIRKYVSYLPLTFGIK